MKAPLAAMMRFFEGQAGEAAATDPVLAVRHRDFITTRFLAGLVGVAVFPIWLAIGGSPTLFAALTFAWLVAPLPVAAYLGSGGSLVTAHILSAFASTGLFVWLALMTGGPTSPMLVWLAVIPADAATSGLRRVATIAAGFVAIGLAAVWTLSLTGVTVPQLPLGTAGSIACFAVAVFWMGVIAFRIIVLDRAGERAAQAGEERYRLLAEHATDMITRHSANGAVEFASPAARALLGTGTLDLLGDGLFERVHVADRPTYLSALSDAMTRGATTTAEYRLRREDLDGPNFVWVETRCRLAAFGDDEAQCVVAVTRDIGDRKAHEIALGEAREAAEAANAAKSRFLAHMSHELRTPLNAIIGFSDILTNELFGQLQNGRHRDYARLIHSSGEHLLQVVNDLLDMSKIEAGRFEIAHEWLEVAPLVDGCRELMAHQAEERGVHLRQQVEPDLPDLNADRRACKQILINLVANAVKFSRTGGTVTVGARRDGDSILFSVEDQGVGIAKEDLPRLGTPFVQADSAYNRRYQGTGLGLSVVKGLAKLHGGSISIRSELDVGTTVTVALPIAGDATASNEMPWQAEAEPARIQERKRA